MMCKASPFPGRVSELCGVGLPGYWVFAESFAVQISGGTCVSLRFSLNFVTAKMLATFATRDAWFLSAFFLLWVKGSGRWLVQCRRSIHGSSHGLARVSLRPRLPGCFRVEAACRPSKSLQRGDAAAIVRHCKVGEGGHCKWQLCEVHGHLPHCMFPSDVLGGLAVLGPAAHRSGDYRCRVSLQEAIAGKLKLPLQECRGAACVRAFMDPGHLRLLGCASTCKLTTL